MSAVTALASTRSPLAQLSSITTPTLLIQGRRDFLFDIDQALAAYKRLKGPKRLYLGDLGHAPGISPATAPDAAIYWGEARQVVRPLPQGRRTAIAAAVGRRARSRSVRRQDDDVQGAPADEDDLGRAARQHDDERRDRQGRAQRPRHRRAARDVRRHDGDRRATRARRTGTGSSRCSRSAATRRPISAGGVKLSAASGTATIKLMNEAVRIPAGQEARRLSQLDVARAGSGERALSRGRAARRADHDRTRDAQALRADEGRLAMIRVLARARSGCAARRARRRRAAGRRRPASRRRRSCSARPARSPAPSRSTSRC